MIHPDTELKFINHEIGYGVVATKFIPKGTITWSLDKLDHIFTPLELNDMDDIYKSIISKYTFRDKCGNFILCWDNGRYVNHSFRSNCITTAYEFELAVRDIHVGEELTDDYGYLNVTEPFDCLPEKWSRRKRVNPDDPIYYHKNWDKKLRGAFKEFRSVEQPLKELIDAEVYRKCLAISQGEARMDSVLTCYYPGSNNLMEDSSISVG
ncbi:MAG: SET domain-containing protein [Thermodesulfovibrionia bacterium]|nr:SET domain-containing protein [Thermodesulfovibrionia bacterium]